MRMFVTALASGLVLAGLSSPAEAAKEPVVLKARTPWNVDFGETKCRLARAFGEGEDKHVLLVDQHSPSSGASVTVAGPSFRRFTSRKETLVALGDATEPFEAPGMKAELGPIGYGLVFSNIYFLKDQPAVLIEARKAGSDNEGTDNDPVRISGQLDSEFGADIEYLSFKQGSREVRLETGPLGEAFEVLNTCTSDMLKDWGFDVETQRLVAKGPVWTNRDAVTRRIVDSYPRAALRRGESAILRMRVTIDEQGGVEDCVINEVTRTETLESPACEQMQKAEFEPAVNVVGQPVRSFFTTSITYRIN
ncbi:TonB family protein [Erythrobacter sp. SCSIO 43205]|uniref:TonB family protein n=1 Tax=Erythrobacter sp. SCSIO 43205 TaxID=2779361 RepID=UPI001CA91E43|nr:TonB family protein [Erythrobacter sp. SCSIO 43205]UAB79110.1 TonB family protein [Erythrobacter sp. SCSIO 43205]